MPTTTITLAGPNAPTSITLRATAPETPAPTTIPGIVHRSQGGSVITYRVGPQFWEFTLQCRSLTLAQAESLNSFYGANFGQSLTYTDENANAFTAKFLDNALPIKKRFGDCYDCDIHLNLSGLLT